MTLLCVFLASFFSVGFFWFTIAKVAEISSELRTLLTKNLVMVMGITALLNSIVTVVLVYYNHPWYVFSLHSTLLLFTITFGLCRFGIFCYKTQKSIGARYTSLPDDQFWI